MKGSLLLHNLKLNCLIFSTDLNGSLIIFIRTYTVNYRNALDRLRVRMNIVLLIKNYGYRALHVLDAVRTSSSQKVDMLCRYIIFIHLYLPFLSLCLYTIQLEQVEPHQFIYAHTSRSSLIQFVFDFLVRPETIVFGRT